MPSTPSTTTAQPSGDAYSKPSRKWILVCLGIALWCLGDAIYSFNQALSNIPTIIPVSGIGTFTINWFDFWGGFLLAGLFVSGLFFLLMAIGLWRRW